MASRAAAASWTSRNVTPSAASFRWRVRTLTNSSRATSAADPCSGNRAAMACSTSALKPANGSGMRWASMRACSSSNRASASSACSMGALHSASSKQSRSKAAPKRIGQRKNSL